MSADEQVERLRDSALWLCDCEIDCIKDGNALTPTQQAVAIAAVRNVQARLLSSGFEAHAAVVIPEEEK